jgi:Fur family ferric uptake transcriptional regulator
MDNPEHLNKVGLKTTLPRLKVLNLFETSEEKHWSADDVYKRLLDSGENIGLATVYRVLTQFEQAGLLLRHHFEGGKSVFELNEGEHHDHIVCLQCGHVEEFRDSAIEVRQEKVTAELGFVIREHSLQIYADCVKNNCSHKAKGNSSA